MAKQLSSFQPKYNSLTDGLISYWKLDESSGNASDSVGSNTLTNTNVTYSTGKINNGAIYNASNAKLVMGSTAFTPSYTYSFWIYRNTNGQYGVISKDDGTTRVFSFLSNTDGTLSGTVWLSTGSFGITAFSLTNNTWNHVVITLNSGVECKVYLNGTEVFTNSISFGALTTSFGTWFGADQFSGGRWFLDGKLDEIGLWNRALTAGEVTQLYNSSSGKQLDVLPSSTKLYMPLNGNSVDISGSGNHGTDTAITYVGGKFGQGARFNGSSSIITFNDCPQTGNGAFTVSGWFNSSSLASRQCVASFGTGSTSQGITCDIDSSKLYADFYGSTSVVGTVVLKPNTFYYATYTWDGTNIRLYLNGKLDGTSANTSANIVDGSGAIGRAFWIAQNPFNGILDEIVLENRAWTAQEISLYYRKSMLNYRAKSASLFSNFISYLLTATQQTYTLTGIATLFHFALRMLATVQTYTLTGIANTFRLGKGLVANVASYILTGNATNFTKALRMIGTVATYTLTGISATLIYIKQVIGELGQFILTGNPVNFRFKGWTKTPKDRGGTWTKTPKN